MFLGGRIEGQRPPPRMRKLFSGLTVVAAIGVAVYFALPASGRWLVVEDPLQSASGIVILGGQMPFRAIEAANLYHQGWAPEIWITQGAPREEDVALREIGVMKIPEDEYSRRVLVVLGVPDAAIHSVARPVENTAQEVQAIAEQLVRDGNRLILVTSKYHGRRLRALWHALVPLAPPPVIRIAPGDPFQPDRWWRSTRDAEHVFHEWFGLINAWAGLPLQSVRLQPD